MTLAPVTRRLRRVGRRALQRVYGFDSWHVGHGGEPYVADIVRYLNARPEGGRQSVVEIGCGLGDILRPLRFRSRLGLDREREVVRAARARGRFQRGLRFDVFEFPTSALDGQHDAIVTVNWIHAIAPDVLRPAIADYVSRHLRTGGCLILDTVPDPAYTYNHDVRSLAPAGVTIERIGGYARGREVWALVKST
jgi:SAM-dependent methyltransferase